jgi:hypothetical protein
VPLASSTLRVSWTGPRSARVLFFEPKGASIPTYPKTFIEFLQKFNKGFFEEVVLSKKRSFFVRFFKSALKTPSVFVCKR